MHGGLVQCNPAAGAASSGQLRPLLPLGEAISCFIDGDDSFPDGRSFACPKEENLGTDFRSADLLKQAKFEALEGGEQSAMSMSNLTSASGEASVSSGTRGDGGGSVVQQHQGATAATVAPTNNTAQVTSVKRKRNLPGTPDPDAEVVTLSPKTLMATNRFVCEICNKGFQRDQNLQLHRRGHNLPWKLRQRTSKEIRKRVYVCPEPSCVHHDPARALGDLTGIKKHFCRKHGEKKWKCERCSKRYAVQSDWKAHSKTCGTREYRCDCGTIFSRRDSFITHRAFCDALAEESARVSVGIQVGGQHSNTLSTLQAGGPMPMVGVPSSPGKNDALSSASMRSGTHGSASRLGFTENGFSLLPPRWEQTNETGAATPGSRPRLSLWLGPGPGPGPPSGGQLIGIPQLLQSGGSSSLNPLDMSAGFFAHSPKNVQGGAGMVGILGSSDYEGQKPLTGSIQFGWSGSGNHFGNSFTSGVPLPVMGGSGLGQAGGITNAAAMSGLADVGGMATWTDRNSTVGRLSLTTSAGLGSNSTFGNTNSGGGLPSASSIYNPSHTPGPQMSATALLQKAAQMGATASNTSLLRGFGMASADSSSGSFGTAWSGTCPEQGRGAMPNMVSHAVQSHPLMKAPSDLSAISQALGAHSLGGNTKSNENAALNELMNSLSGSASSFGHMNNFPSHMGPFGDSGNIAGMYQKENGQLQRCLPSRDRMRQLPQPPGGPQAPPMMGSSMLAGLGSLSRGEDGSGDRLTRDFLGVGGATRGMVGAAGGIGRTFSQRDLASLASLGSRMDMGQFNSSSEN